MPRALKVCSQQGCPELCESGRCHTHERQADRARGTWTDRGYNTTHWRGQRRACLRRDPLCQCEETKHGHGHACYEQATVADHYPNSRRELVEAGIPDPDNTRYLRSLCKSCHDKHTAATTPGGWNKR